MSLHHEHLEDDQLEHAHAHRRGETVVAREATSVREPIGLGQMLSLATAVFFVVLGAVGLARGGIESATDPRTHVAGLVATPLLSFIHLAIGLIASVGATSRAAARGVLLFLGAGLIALGIIAWVQGVEALGWNDANGAAYLIVGILAIAAAMATPLVAFEERRLTGV